MLPPATIPCAAFFVVLRCLLRAALRESVGEILPGRGGSAADGAIEEPGRAPKLDRTGVEEDVVIAY